MRIYGLITLLVLASCASLPSSGPSAYDVHDNTAAEFLVLDLDAELVAKLGTAKRPSIPDILGTSDRPQIGSLGVGDQLTITIWESAPDGLFSTATDKRTVIEASVTPEQTIFVPYAGKIAVNNLDVSDVRLRIAEKLQGQAVDPQVQVALTNSISQTLTVVGDVSAPGQFSIPPAGIRLIDAVALAGGASSPSFETQLTVVRDGVRATVPLDGVLAGQGNNIQMRSGDVVELQYRPRSFTAFGAVTDQNYQTFTNQDVSLAEALAQSGGLNDSLADAGGVFLFRVETVSRLQGLQRSTPLPRTPQGVPVVYRLDLSTPQAFFFGKPVHDL